jgi:hypothetical protein
MTNDLTRSCLFLIVGCRCRVLTVDCRVSIVECRLLIAGCWLSSADCWLSGVDCRVLTVDCRVSIDECWLMIVRCRCRRLLLVPEPEFVNLIRSPGIDSQPGGPVNYPIWCTGPPGYISWRNLFLWIDSWAHKHLQFGLWLSGFGWKFFVVGCR